jgi:hypothetical protein
VGRPIQRDTATSDTLQHRPQVNTPGGRVVLSGGGIVPDSVVRPAPDSAADALARGLAGDQPRWRALVRSVAVEAGRGSRAEPATLLSDALHRLQVAARDSGLALPPDFWSSAAPAIERQLGDELMEVLQGEAARLTRQVRRDPLVAKAVELLHRAPTPTALVLGREP